MEPLPETRAVLAELSGWGDADLAADLTALTERARAIVPELVGVSVAAIREGLTFTFVATGKNIAVLDGVQYLDGGPCVQAAHLNREVSVEDTDALSEGEWLMFARAGAVAGIQSTLSLPVTRKGSVVGGVNLYANREHAFVGRHQELAELFGAWAGGAVANADLSFTTQEQARKGPATLKANARIDNAVGVIIAIQGVSAAEARQRLDAAADLAGVSPLSIANTILNSLANNRQ